MSTQPLYVPYPDPRYPETMKQEHIDTLREWGVIAVSAWANREEYKRDSGSYDTWPAEGTTGKTWCNTAAIVWGDSKRYLHYRLLRDERGRPIVRPLNYSDEMFSYMPPNLAQCFRSRPHLFAQVPLWRRVEFTAAEAQRLNFDAVTVDDIPVARFHDVTEGEVGQGNAFPGDVAFRFRPDAAGQPTEVVEFFKIERFMAANPPQSTPAVTPAPATRKLPDAVLVQTAREVLASTRPVAELAAAIRRLANS